MKILNFSKTIHTIFIKFNSHFTPKGPLRAQWHRNRMTGIRASEKKRLKPTPLPHMWFWFLVPIEHGFENTSMEITKEHFGVSKMESV